MARAGFVCDCCGHWTLPAAPTGESMQLCPVCGWEDSEAWWERDREPVDVAQRRYAETGIAVPSLHDVVREPTAAEQRCPRWKAYDGRAAELLSTVEAVFADIALPRHLNPTDALRDAELSDTYGYDSFTRPEPGLWHPVDSSAWTDLRPVAVYYLFCGVGGLNFMNANTFRFFVPPVARLYLQEWTTKPSEWFWPPLFHFCHDSAAPRHIENFSGYSSKQLAWLAAFVGFVLRPGSRDSRRDRHSGAAAWVLPSWANYWSPRLSDEYVASYGRA